MIDAMIYYIYGSMGDSEDPVRSTLFGMKTPSFFYSIGMTLIVLIKYIIPSIMQLRKPVDIKPICIISSGLAFGTYAIGLALLVFVKPPIQETLSPKNILLQTMDLSVYSVQLISYLFIYFKLYDFSVPIIYAFGKRYDKITNLYLIQLGANLMLSWLIAKRNPVGLWIVFIISDMMYQTSKYAYLVLSAASDEVRPRLVTRIKIKNAIQYSRYFTILISLSYLTYFVLKYDCSSPRLQLYGLIYFIFCGVLYPIDIRYRRSIDKKQDSKEIKIK